MAEVTSLVASKLDKETVCRHLRLDAEYVDEAEWKLIDAMRRSAIEYICDHCAITPDEVDEHEDLAIAMLVLVSDMYDERSTTVGARYDNRTVTMMLSHHDRNFLGSEEAEDAVG